MIYFKACPRCNGDMHIANDMYGRYLECLQCGHESEVKQDPSVAAIWESPRAKRKVGAKAA